MKGTPEQKKKYKAKYREKTNSNKWKRIWTDEEDSIILKHEYPDRKLSEMLQRSVTAIQVRRNRLLYLKKREMPEEEDDYIRDNYFLNFQAEDWEE